MKNNVLEKPIALVKKAVDGLIKITTISSNVAGVSRATYVPMEEDLYVYEKERVTCLAYLDKQSGQYIDIYDRTPLMRQYHLEPFCAIKYNPRNLENAALVYGRFLDWYNDGGKESLIYHTEDDMEKLKEICANLYPVTIATIDTGRKKIEDEYQTEKVERPMTFHEESNRYFAYLYNSDAYILKDIMGTTEYREDGTIKNQVLTGSYDKYPILVAEDAPNYYDYMNVAVIKNEKVMEDILSVNHGANLEYIYQVWKAFEQNNPDIVVNHYHKNHQKHL